MSDIFPVVLTGENVGHFYMQNFRIYLSAKIARPAIPPNRQNRMTGKTAVFLYPARISFGDIFLKLFFSGCHILNQPSDA